MRRRSRSADKEGEFLWLISLSDLMILLFIFFVTLFSFSYQKMGAADLQRLREMLSGKKAEATPLDEVQVKLMKWLVDKNLMAGVQVEQKEDALILQVKEKFLFGSGDFQLREEGVELVDLISKALEKVPKPYRIGVEGHTDDSPIETSHVRDNWDLSSKRAHSVLKALKLPSETLERAVIMGYGPMKPLLPNRDHSGQPIATNQQQNRRVTIRIF